MFVNVLLIVLLSLRDEPIENELVGVAVGVAGGGTVSVTDGVRLLVEEPSNVMLGEGDFDGERLLTGDNETELDGDAVSDSSDVSDFVAECSSEAEAAV